MEPNLAEDDVFEVERILKKRHHPKRGDLYYVKWKNFPNSKNTWEPAENFAPRLLEEFESSHKSRKQLAVFNPVGSHTSLPVAKEVVYEPELTKGPIVVTDVTAKDSTVTICECNTPEGFFH